MRRLGMSKVSKGSILWVDDEIDLLRPHIILLEQKDYTVTTVSNGYDAIEIVRDRGFDLVFLDESMIGMSGIETLVQLKEIRPNMPVVMCTKNEAESLMDEAIGRKINDYLTKPVNPVQIIAAVKKFLESRDISQQRITKDYLQEFSRISARLQGYLAWEDWLEIYVKLVNYSLEMDKYPELGLQDSLQDQWRECNAEFSKFVERNYQDWIFDRTDDRPLLSPEITEEYMLPHLTNSKGKVVYIVVDCMRLDQWLLMEEMLYPYYTMKTNYACSILPTSTPYARNAIFAGMFPLDIQKHYPQYWKGENTEEHSRNTFEKELLTKLIGRKRINLPNDITYLKIIDTDYGKKIEADIARHTKNKLTAIVFNAVDMIAHSRSDLPILKEIAPDEPAYRSLTKSWFAHSSLFGILKALSKMDDVTVVITTDHGSVRCLHGVKALGDADTSTNLRYKFGRNVKADARHAYYVRNPEEIRLPKGNMIDGSIIAKQDYYFVYPTEYNYYVQKYKDSFQHGGISLEEMILPVIELKPKK